MAHDAEVVGDEEIAESAGALQLIEQVEHLRLHRHIKTRHRFVADQDVGARRNGARDRDALLLAAGEVPRTATGELGGEPIGGQKLGNAGRAAQGMMLAAWNEGVGSCPNAFADREAISELVGVGDGEEVAIVLSFGYPPGRSDPGSRSLEEWLAAREK